MKKKAELKIFMFMLLLLHHARHSSVQFSRSVVSDFLQSHGLQHARLPCPSPTHVSPRHNSLGL